MVERAQIIVKGIVQGVGFRPHVFNLARSLCLTGYVANTSEGVFVDIEGSKVDDFLSRVRSEAPTLSQITDFVVTKLPSHGYSDFTIRHSIDQGNGLPFTLISPDMSICPDCLKELLDPADRRYLYPFINCTNCGPRYSIIRSTPYDRPNTTMSAFTMCPRCEAEYHDPRNRRFHAQPNACAECGPSVELRHASPLTHPTRLSGEGKGDGQTGAVGPVNGEAIYETIKMLQQGGIVAIKGLGGFHIGCDASNDAAVRRLRARKRKSNKPFAIMAPSLDAAERYCLISEDEIKLLQSNRRPVVLLRKRHRTGFSEVVSPNNQYLGVMLPYTPLHYLLFYQPPAGDSLKEPHFSALVMTSGNLSGEPIVRDNEEAIKKLSQLVDGFLLHNRDIFMGVDDSVLRLSSDVSFIRRSRSYAPDAIELPGEGPEVLACGADLKNTFTIAKGKFAIPSQHIGNMENYETVKFFEESLDNLKTVYRADPRIIVHDLHPGYLSAKWAIESGTRNPDSGVETYGVQHHYAHIGSVMAEHGLRGRVLGVAFDGTGYGTDGNLWGGEFLIADLNGFERAGQLKYVPLPGGEAAIREPWKTAVSLIMEAEGDKAWHVLEKIGFVHEYGREALTHVMSVASSRELSPLASGAGRLFDGVSALLGVCDRNSFEGEAAMTLEALTTAGIDGEYPVEIAKDEGYRVADFSASIRAMVADRERSVATGVIATRFHNTVASLVRTLVLDLGDRTGIGEVCLSGGTFQNPYLVNRIVSMLSSAGMKVFTNHRVPCNDGGISLGQAYLIREKLKQRPGSSDSPRKEEDGLVL